MTVNVGDNRYGVARLIVAPTIAEGANFTTIASALTAASSGQTIFIRPGTYTENLTLKAGVDLCSFGGEGDSGNVTIIGNNTASFTGTCSITGIRLQTNAAPFLTVSGANATIVRIRDCYFNCADNAGISWTTSNSASNLFVYDCSGTAGAATATLFVATGDGVIRLENVEQFYGSNVTTASSTSTAQVLIKFCTFNFPLATSSTGTIGGSYLNIQTQNQNTTCITTAGTGQNGFEHCNFASGTASALSLGAGTTTTLHMSTYASTNTNAITGAGTLYRSCNAVDGTNGSATHLVNVTTQNYQYTDLGRYLAPGQPGFLVYNANSITNVTGDGTSYTVIWDTEIFDTGGNFNTGTGTFAAPITGKYNLYSHILMNDMAVTFTGSSIQLATSNRGYSNGMNVASAGAQRGIQVSALSADMDAADTCTVIFLVSGSTKTIDVQQGGATDFRSWFGGALAF